MVVQHQDNACWMRARAGKHSRKGAGAMRDRIPVQHIRSRKSGYWDPAIVQASQSSRPPSATNHATSPAPTISPEINIMIATPSCLSCS